MALTASLSPYLLEEVTGGLRRLAQEQHPYIIIWETLTGSAIGLMARFFFLALQFSATAISNFIGLAGIPGVPLEEGDTGSPLSTLVSSAAVMLVFAMGLHVELMIAIMESYRVIVPGESPAIGALMLRRGRTNGLPSAPGRQPRSQSGSKAINGRGRPC